MRVKLSFMLAIDLPNRCNLHWLLANRITRVAKPVLEVALGVFAAHLKILGAWPAPYIQNFCFAKEII